MSQSRPADLATLLRTMDPVLHDGVYVYVSLPAGSNAHAGAAIATFREEEGLTLILPEGAALETNLPVQFRAAWITLTVRSELDAVGLTAAVSSALSDAGISCNVLAAAHHDHLFVPFDRAEDAMAALRTLQRVS